MKLRTGHLDEHTQFRYYYTLYKYPLPLTRQSKNEEKIKFALHFYIYTLLEVLFSSLIHPIYYCSYHF